MNSKVPTITIQTENGPVLINATDYDPEVHETVDGAEPTTETAVKPAEPVKMLVSKEGRKHFIVGEDGKKISAEGIEEKGYGSEADAWSAIMALNTTA